MNDFNKKFTEAAPEFDYIHFLSAKIDADNERVTLYAVYERTCEAEYEKSRERIREAAASLFPPYADVNINASAARTGRPWPSCFSACFTSAPLPLAADLSSSLL